MTRRMTALVIGNAAYENVDELRNPANDAQDIGRALEDNGFSVIQETDCRNADMDRALKQFRVVLGDSDVGLFFFAGHGMQIDGENYLAAVDTDGSDEIAAKHSSLPLNRVIEVMEKSGCATSIIVLDACRNNPFERAWSRSISVRGLAPVYAPRGTLIAYATSPGQVASDGSGRNGAYTSALLQHIATPDCAIENMFKRVRNTLSAATRGKQISWEHTSLAGEFFFNLSLGARIDTYEVVALSDRLFVLDEAKVSHRLIRELKSLTWPRQNPAIEAFSTAVANKASVNSLFVVGRNIYQSACGGSKAANAYLADFASRTSGIKEEKRKALLDGILFEIFYDPDGKLRRGFKMRKFQEVFALQRHPELQPSFDFIAECLLPEVARFHAIPGKRHAVVVDVLTRPGAKADLHTLESMHCGGENILWQEDEDYTPEAGEPRMVENLSLTRFEERVAEQMVMPKHLLTINYPDIGKMARGQIAFPLGWTARKR